MTSVSIRDRHEFTCDSCGEEAVVISDDFTEAWGAKKSDGWTIFKHEQHWHHECPKCSQETA